MTKLYEEIFKLKTLKRKGWVIRNITDKETGRVESDAEHVFTMAMLAIEIMQREKLQLDELKVIKMVLYHELCEIDAGDHTPYDDITLEDKYAKELAGVERLAREYDMPEILSIWKEFEENKTPEAKFVKKIDKLEAIMQSQIYSKQIGDDKLFNEFFETSKEVIGDLKKYL